jgi:hypothetical protein
MTALYAEVANRKRAAGARARERTEKIYAHTLMA